MNSKAELEDWLDSLPTGSKLSNAIDVVARLTEQAERMAGKGDNAVAMSVALGAAFGYMVAYCRHLTLECRTPHDALAKAAAGVPELKPDELDLLRAASRGVALSTM